ncbi:MAG TPA: hypothetical protein DCF73_00490, partial [Rhodobiaceae bacterium]|nr:hypothetical protein [Rhodobiaceae bacterium]
KTDGTIDGLASTSSTSPTMPSGYTYKALIGAVRTKSGSAVLVGTIQYGRSVQYTTPALPSLSSGAVGTYGSTWGAAISVSALVPTAIAARIYVLAWNTGTNSRIVVAPNSSYDPAIDSATKAPPVGGGGVTGASNTTTSSTVGSFLLESTNVYVSSAASTQSVVVGFDLNL